MDAPKSPRRNYDYDAHRTRMGQVQAAKSKSARDIGTLPEVVDPDRRERCRLDFRLFLETYFPRAFPLRWSDDHLTMIAAVQRAVLTGGLQAIAMPRGTGKTSICERAVLWASLYGHSPFSLLIAADKTKAQASLAKIILELETNELLGADFPEACVPIRALEGIANRARGQLYEGERTYIGYGKDKLVFAAIPGAACSGVVLGVGGIKSAVRGANHTTREGTILRPRLVLIDDPQTRDSAGSPKQCATREAIISADILGCAAPGESIAALLTVTVIERGDVADRLLDRAKHPTWHGLRCKLLYAFPTEDAMRLWEEYWQLRCDELVNDGDGSLSTAFYRDRREAMDAGARVAWEERYKDEDISALQHAMNLFFEDRAAFFSEFQNEPEDEVRTTRLVAAETIALKLNNLPRMVVASRDHLVVCFVDVHEDLLYWGVVGWGDGFSGDVLDYGVFPPQRRKYFAKREARPTLVDWHARETGQRAGDVTIEEALHAGLTSCTNDLFGRPWIRQDDAQLAIRRCLIDASHGPTTAVVKSFCANSAHKESIWPSHGVGKNKLGMFLPSKQAREKGDRFGFHWRVTWQNRRANIGHISFNANFWKTFLWQRLRVGQGATGSLNLFGEWASARANGKPRPRDPELHRLLIDHLHAETPREVAVGETKIEEWIADPSKDNHFLDVLVGCCVAASYEGLQLTSHAMAGGSQRQRKKFSMRRAA